MNAINKSTQAPKKLMIMAAGTGGHIFPGLAVAEEMRQRGWTISWLGTEIGMEGEIVAKHHIEMDKLDFSGLRGKGLKHSLIGGYKLLKSFFSCLRIIYQRQPDVVLGMGGYVTVPGGICSALLGKPLVLMNADAALLLSNKVLKPLAKKVMFGLPLLNAAKQNVLDTKCIFTGNPIREELAQIEVPQDRYAKRTGPLRLLIVGGSLGAKVLNEIVPDALALLPIEHRPMIVHQSGKQHIDALRQRYQALAVDAEVLDFIHDMPKRYAEADYVICRAGAITLSELTATGVASILVPLVASSTSHQRANAQWLNQVGGAVHFPQSEMTAVKLAEMMLTMNRSRCQELAQAAYLVGRRSATGNIAAILEELK